MAIRVQHPADRPPASETLGGTEYAVTDGALDLPSEQEVRALARYYGVAAATIREDRCGEPIQSGRREGAPCDEPTPCQYHDH